MVKKQMRAPPKRGSVKLEGFGRRLSREIQPKNLMAENDPRKRKLRTGKWLDQMAESDSHAETVRPTLATQMHSHLHGRRTYSYPVQGLSCPRLTYGL